MYEDFPLVNIQVAVAPLNYGNDVLMGSFNPRIQVSDLDSCETTKRKAIEQEKNKKEQVRLTSIRVEA